MTSPGRPSCSVLLWTLCCKRQERRFVEGFWGLEGRGKGNPDLTIPGLFHALPTSVTCFPTTGGPHKKGAWSSAAQSQIPSLSPKSKDSSLPLPVEKSCERALTDCAPATPFSGPSLQPSPQDIGTGREAVCSPLMFTLLHVENGTKRC